MTDDFLNLRPHGSLMTGIGCEYRAAPRFRVRLYTLDGLQRMMSATSATVSISSAGVATAGLLVVGVTGCGRGIHQPSRGAHSSAPCRASSVLNTSASRHAPSELCEVLGSTHGRTALCASRLENVGLLPP